jgi:AcrR family transcriptional regulator
MAITRTEMGSTARERLLDTALAALGEDGREALDAARLAARAGVAEDELEAEFADLDACLDAAYEQFVDRLGDAVRSGCERGRARAAGAAPAEAWPARVRGGLEALLAELAASPARAVALVRTYPALGAARRRRYEAFVADLPPLLAEGRQLAATSGAALPDEVELLAVGAAEAIVFEAVESGRAAALAEMAPAILFSLLVPFIGADAAAAEMEKVGGGP